MHIVFSTLDFVDPRTKFFPRFTTEGKWAFESVCDRGKYIVMEKIVTGNRTEIKFRLGVPRNNSELFEHIAPFSGFSAYKSSGIEPEHCYMGFDSFGNRYGKLLCQVDTSHMSTIIMHIESIDVTNCQYTQLRSSKIELWDFFPAQ